MSSVSLVFLVLWHLSLIDKAAFSSSREGSGPSKAPKFLGTGIFCAITSRLFYLFSLCLMQPPWMCWCRTAKSTMMPAATFLQMASSWQLSSPAAKGAFPMKASWRCTPWPPTTWVKCSTPSDLVRDGKPNLWQRDAGTLAWAIPRWGTA